MLPEGNSEINTCSLGTGKYVCVSVGVSVCVRVYACVCVSVYICACARLSLMVHV